MLNTSHEAQAQDVGAGEIPRQINGGTGHEKVLTDTGNSAVGIGAITRNTATRDINLNFIYLVQRFVSRQHGYVDLTT